MNFSTNTTAGTIRRSSIYQDNEMSQWEWFGRRLLMMVPYVLAVAVYAVICCFLEEWLNCLREKYCPQTCPTPFRIRGGYRGRASRQRELYLLSYIYYYYKLFVVFYIITFFKSCFNCFKNIIYIIYMNSYIRIYIIFYILHNNYYAV